MRTSPYYAMLLAASLLPSIGMAQDELSMDPNLNPSLGPQPRVVYGSPPGATPADPYGSNLAWGTQLGATWIAASQFTVRLNSSAPVLTYAGNHFYRATGAASSERYFAQLAVEPGVLFSHLTCVYNDSSDTDNVAFGWMKYVTNLNTGVTTPQTVDHFVTSGAPGVGLDALFPTSSETMSIYDGSFGLINHYLYVDVTANTSFAGCYAFWNRQVAPAPAVASFADVPTGHPQFQFIEALVDAGITSGCDGGNYCPGAPLTRGQMAVFLAKAFGLGFQY